MANSLIELHTQQKQSPWLDFIRRSTLKDGGLKRYIDEDGIRGVTANPTIFAQAIAAGDDYDGQIGELLRDGVDPHNMFDRIAFDDICAAADILRPVYESSGGGDGFVSIEVSPEKAFDTQATIDEATRWWNTLKRPNIMVKVPATAEGIPAIEECIAAGININVTLLFALDFYARAIEAYLRGIERRVASGQDVRSSNSVASFFVSRVDTAADKLIDTKVAAADSDAERRALQGLSGRIAVANAKVAYQHFLQVFGSDRFKQLAAKGARAQRPLWAPRTRRTATRSTSRSSSALTPSTRCRRPRSMHFAITASSGARSTKTSPGRGRC
jgi:transaldolase